MAQSSAFKVRNTASSNNPSKQAMPKTRSHADTTLSLAPMTVDEALAALLNTPSPPADNKSTTTRVTSKAKLTKRRRR